MTPGQVKITHRALKIPHLLQSYLTRSLPENLSVSNETETHARVPEDGHSTVATPDAPRTTETPTHQEASATPHRLHPWLSGLVGSVPA